MSSLSSSSSKRLSFRNPKSVAVDRVSWYCAICLLVLILFGSINADSWTDEVPAAVMRGRSLVADRPCDEIYVVSEGETLHTISDKCGDPFIVERNPHIQDPDDVFPGLVIKIIPSSSGSRN